MKKNKNKTPPIYSVWATERNYYLRPPGEVLSYSLTDPRFPIMHPHRYGLEKPVLKAGEFRNTSLGERFSQEVIDAYFKEVSFHSYSSPPKYPKKLRHYAYGYGCEIVSDVFKEVVEKLDPDVHQFLPIQIRDHYTGKIIYDDHEWFIFNCLRLFLVDEVMDIEAMKKINELDVWMGLRTRVVWNSKFEKNITTYSIPNIKKGFVLSQKFLDKIHKMQHANIFMSRDYYVDFWTYYSGGGRTFCTEKFRKALIAAGIKNDVITSKMSSPQSVIGVFLKGQV